MFHPHFLDLFFGNPHSMADTMRLVAAFKVEQDLQDKWREERERKVSRTSNAIVDGAECQNPKFID